MWELDYKESWALKNWCFGTVVLEKTLESPLDCKEIQPVPPKGDQSWVFHWKDSCCNGNSNTLATWCQELTHWRRPWYWERMRAGGEVALLSNIQHLHYFVNKGPSSQGYGFSSSHVWMWEMDHKESWALKNWWFWTVVLEKTLDSLLDCKEIQPVPPKGNQSWIFIGRTDAEAETQ